MSQVHILLPLETPAVTSINRSLLSSMVERTAQKPLYLAMENATIASPIIQMIRRYPNLETLRVAKPPGKLSVFMVEREPSLVIVDAQIAPPLISKAKSRVPWLSVIIIAPQKDIDQAPFSTSLRTHFLSENCSQRELHAMLDNILSENKDPKRASTVADMAAIFAVGDHRGTLDIRNLETGETGKISFSRSILVGSSVGDLDGPEAFDLMKKWGACDFRWNDVLEGFDDSFLEEVSLSLLAEASELVADERGGLVEATDTSMFPMSFDSDVELEEVSQTNDFFPDLMKAKITPKTKITNKTEPISISNLQRESGLNPTGQLQPPSEHLAPSTDVFYPKNNTPKAKPEIVENLNQKFSQAGNASVSTSTAEVPQKSETKQNNLIIGALMASNASEILQELTTISGFIAGAVVDSDSGMTLAKLSNSMGFDIDVAAATNTEVIKAKLRAAKALKLDDNIEDILITLTNQYHILRPLEEYPSIFFYIALDREQANLAMARIKLKTVGSKIKL